MKKTILILVAILLASCTTENEPTEPKEFCTTIIGYSATSCKTPECKEYNYSLQLKDGRSIPFKGNPTNMIGQFYCEIK